MFRLLKDHDPETPAVVSTFPENGNFKCVGDDFIEKINPFMYNEDLLKIKAGCAIDLFNGEDWRQMPNNQDINFDPVLNLDTGNTLEYGADYSIYLCLAGLTPEIVVSKNNTFPNGFTANNSRKIGGFHYGAIRKVSDDGLWVPIDSVGNKFGSSGIAWQNNVTEGIIPNAVWDLKNRPKTLMDGLVKVSKNTWAFIYQASVKAAINFMSGTNLVHVKDGELQSKYGQLPATGTEGLCQYNFVELAERAGMRLLSYAEWLCAAYGNPQGEDGADNYGWTKTSNSARARTGCSVNNSNGAHDPVVGIKPYAVSAKNVVDCVGNVWEWLSDYSNRHDAGSGSWTYHNQLGAGMGQIYAWKVDGFVALIAGGSWYGDVFAGPRAINTLNRPWTVGTAVGSRLACDAA